MSENLSFKFYSVLKNEDADPFASEGLMVVADGLGGAGSVVHELESWRYKKAEDFIKKTLLIHALPEYREQEHPYLKSYIDTWLEPMVDTEPDTSALWASRIAIARFVFALTEKPEFLQGLADEDIRKEICKFVIKGLDRTVDAFRLKPGKYDNQKLLPTTLAALSYFNDGEDVLVDAVWAGDSRCYVLMPDGLKQLTIDDEDNAEAITNLFYAADRYNQRPYKPAILRYRKYKFKKPCVLLAVSDGVFDPYAPHDNLGVEAVLLEKLLECKSSEELSDALKAHYDKVHGDDATMIFEPFGFDSYQHMRELFIPRAQKTIDMWGKYNKLRSTLEIIDSPEAADDIIGKITSRTADKIETIAQLLVEAYNGKQTDFVLDAVGTTAIASAVERLKEEFERNKKERLKEAFAKMKKRILSDYADVESKILSRKKIKFSTAKFERAFNDLKSNASELIYAFESFKAAKERYEKAVVEGKSLIEQIIARREAIHRDLAAYRFARDQYTLKLEKEDATLGDIHWFYHKKSPECYTLASFPGEARKFAKKIDDNIKKQRDCKKQFEIAEKKHGATIKLYETAAKAFLAYEEAIISCVDVLFQPVLIDECGFDTGKGEFTLGADVSTVMARDLINEFHRNPKIVEIIVKALADNYDAKSVIDICYNESRLNNFREYHRLKATSSVDAESFKAELEAFMAEYERLLREA